MPSVSSVRAKSTMPFLSETLMSARVIFIWSAIVIPAQAGTQLGPRLRGGDKFLVQPVIQQLFPQRVAVHAQQLRGARLVAMRLEHNHLEHRLFDGLH